MIRLGVVAEGDTEREFVRSVLADHLRRRNVEPTPIMMGGNVSVQRLAWHMAKLYHDHNAVTSLVDFYGFRGKGNATIDALEACIGRQVRSRIHNRWDERKVIPYVQKHEFEALLFACPQAFAEIDVPPEGVKQLAAIRSSLAPEDIDDDPETAPSKRIAAIVPSYNKVVGGAVVALAVGLPAMRAACPRFRAWLTRLEALGSK